MKNWIGRLGGGPLRGLVALLVIGAALAVGLGHDGSSRTPASPSLAFEEADGGIGSPSAFAQANPAPPDFASGAAAVSMTFGQPTIVGIQGIGFEPDLRLDLAHPSRLYSSAPGSLSSNDSWIWHSTDGGKTWKWVTASHPKAGKPVSSCPGGGDTELAVDPLGRLYFNDLTLANFSTSVSGDQGVTFPACSSFSVPTPVVDRQWYAVDGDPMLLAPTGPTANSLYLANNIIGEGAPQCEVSGAGNNVLVIYRSLPGPAAGLLFGPPKTITQPNTCQEGIMGNVEVSPVATTTPQIGQPALAQAVHHVYVPHDDATFSKIAIGRCYPVATTTDPSGLLCDDLPVADLGLPANVRTGANFPTLAIDNAGNLYLVWEQAPIVDANGNIGNTALIYSYSTNEGTTWSTPQQISPPGLNNSVMAWIAAGDDGRVDVAWYGTAGSVNIPNTCALGAVPPPTPHGAPDSVNAPWYLYVSQSLNAHSATPTFSAPLVAGEHHMHRGGIASVMGGLCGDRTAAGDFFQLRIGTQGEANLIYSDSTNANDIGHVMFVRQNGGPGVLLSQTVSGDPIQLNSATDPSGDGLRELDSTPSANLANLDILGSTITKPDPAACNPAGTPCYRVQMTLNNLTLTPPVGAVDTDLVWLTQWLTPSDPACASGSTGCTNGGRNFHVYAELTGALVRCFFGQTSIAPIAGGVTMTYPPDILTEITATGACATATGANGTVTIDVPIANVSLEAGVAPLNANRLYSVTASTMTLSGPSDSVPAFGLPPDVIDVARGYDALFVPTAVRLRSFTAQSRAATVTLRWKTGSEAGLLGFNVYRQHGKARVRLNPALVPARGGLQPHAYVWRGRVPAGAEHARYWLQSVGVDGKRSWLRFAKT